jgi:hypothetical protein
MARMICKTITRSASLIHCTAIVDHVGTLSILIGKRLTIWMLEANVDFAAPVLSKPFLGLMVGEFGVIAHVPVV